MPVEATTTLAVRQWLGLPDGEDNTLASAVDAANAWASRAPLNLTDEDLPLSDDVHLGVTMLAARYHRRRNTPAGVDVIGGETAVYTPRRDPDVEQLLRIGAYAPPRFR